MIGHVVGAIVGHLIRNGAALAATIGLLLVAAAEHLSVPTLGFGAGLFFLSSAAFVLGGGLRRR